MSRYALADPKCRHVPSVRVSSHVDLAAAAETGEPIASTYCCERLACLADARDWLRASTHRTEVHVVPLTRSAR